MKQVVFRYGLLATLAILVLSAIHFFLLLDKLSYSSAELAGYLTMILSMIFVFLGIRYYRDRLNEGFLKFGEGMKIGVLIVLIPAVFFGLFDLLYTEVINPSWLNDYYTSYVERIKASTPADQLEAKLARIAKEKEVFGNPVFQFLLMTATVFIIGLMVTIISALTLRKSRPVASA